MILGYADRAANELQVSRLASGIVGIAVMEKFNLNSTALGAAAHAQPERFSGSFGWGAAHAFIAVGIIAILVATFRFMGTGWLLDDQAVHSPGILPDLALGVILALMLVAVSAYLLLTRSSAP